MNQAAFDATVFTVTAIVLFSFDHPVGAVVAVILAVLSAASSRK